MHTFYQASNSNFYFLFIVIKKYTVGKTSDKQKIKKFLRTYLEKKVLSGRT